MTHQESKQVKVEWLWQHKKTHNALAYMYLMYGLFAKLILTVTCNLVAKHWKAKLINFVASAVVWGHAKGYKWSIICIRNFFKEAADVDLFAKLNCKE
jgi:hypothetical protein